MQSTKASSKGQMVIPKSVRQALGIRCGTELGIELLPDQSFKVTVKSTDQAVLVQRVAGSLAHRGQPLTLGQEDSYILAAVRADDERTRTRPDERP